MNFTVFCLISIIAGVFHGISCGRVKRSFMPNSIRYYLCTTRDQEYLQELINLGDGISATDFNPDHPTRIIIHGWNSYLSDSYDIGNAYLGRGSFNIIIVDWTAYSSWNYIYARWYVTEIGTAIGNMINTLHVYEGLKIEDIIIIGFSMGAHISGVAARTVWMNVPIIVALDPAGPFFADLALDSYASLRRTDATFVQVVHTGAGLFMGYRFNDLGHVNIWVNGGYNQRGCGSDILQSCAHHRAVLYFIESINNPYSAFVATKCETYAKWKNGWCDSNSFTWLGDLDIDTYAKSGKYYVDTNSAPPFIVPWP